MSNENDPEQKILEVHKQAFEIYMDHRKHHPDFTFYLRTKNDKKGRLSRGYIFQDIKHGGNQHVITSPYAVADDRAKLIGFVIRIEKNNDNHKCHVEAKLNIYDNRKKYGNFIEDVIEILPGELSTSVRDSDRRKILSGPWQDNLKFFLEETTPKIKELSKKHGISEKELFFSKEEFEKRLEKINQIQKTLSERNSRSKDARSIKNTENKAGAVNRPLNQILYGPPGTGKTYQTVQIAKSILGVDDDSIKSIAELKDYSPEQVDFVTFHQSFSYEDFIEGLKAISDGEKIRYQIEDGVFKIVCNRARETREEVGKEINIDIEKLLIDFSDYVQDSLDKGKEVVLKDKVSITEVPRKRTLPSFYLGGKIKEQKLSPKAIVRDYEDFVKGNIKGPKDIRPAKMSERDSHGNAGHYYSLYKKIKEFEREQKSKGITYDIDKPFVKRDKNYVLIIDEINRGNVSSIFGELITLLEESKRLGNEEATPVMLPYSKEDFGVPNNLYIVATMNTSDRSLVQVDTALRRRFVFKEILPNPDLLEENIEGINLRKMLRMMNDRIECLYDREHVIGHAYFMKVKSVKDLRNQFRNQILPLLEEYFFDDWEKIPLVLNDKNNRFYEKKKIKKESFSKDIDMQEKSLFHRRNIDSLEAEDFKRIYEFGKDDEE